MKEPFLEVLQSVVEMTDAAQVIHLQEEFRLIQIFLAKEGRRLEKSTLFTPDHRDLNEEKIACLYLLSNSFRLAPYEQLIITNSQDVNLKKHLYGMYRHELLGRLAYLPQEHSKVEYLIMNDGFITEEERQRLIWKHLPNHQSNNNPQEKDIIEAANGLISKGSTL